MVLSFAFLSSCLYALSHLHTMLLMHISSFFSSQEPKTQDELIGWDSSRHPCLRAFTLSNISISETSRPVVIKYHLEHNWGGGLAALGFGPDQIRTVVSMATDSSHRDIIGKTL